MNSKSACHITNSTPLMTNWELPPTRPYQSHRVSLDLTQTCHPLHKTYLSATLSLHIHQCLPLDQFLLPTTIQHSTQSLTPIQHNQKCLNFTRILSKLLASIDSLPFPSFRSPSTSPRIRLIILNQFPHFLTFLLFLFLPNSLDFCHYVRPTDLGSIWWMDFLDFLRFLKFLQFLDSLDFLHFCPYLRPINSD
jgi:hypothetical protein